MSYYYPLPYRRCRGRRLEEPPMIDPGLRAGEESWDEESFKLTANIPKSLHRRASGLVTYAQMHGLGADGKEDIFSLASA